MDRSGILTKKLAHRQSHGPSPLLPFSLRSRADNLWHMATRIVIYRMLWVRTLCLAGYRTIFRRTISVVEALGKSVMFVVECFGI